MKRRLDFHNTVEAQPPLHTNFKPSTDRGLPVAFRIGLALNIVGARIGWRMTAPSAEQIAAVAQGARSRILGAHTVGGNNGGSGLALTY